MPRHVPRRNAQAIYILILSILYSPFRHSWLNNLIKTKARWCQFCDQNSPLALHLTKVWNETPYSIQAISKTQQNLRKTACFLPKTALLSDFSSSRTQLQPHWCPGHLPLTYWAPRSESPHRPFLVPGMPFLYYLQGQVAWLLQAFIPIFGKSPFLVMPSQNCISRFPSPDFSALRSYHFPAYDTVHFCFSLHVHVTVNSTRAEFWSVLYTNAFQGPNSAWYLIYNDKRKCPQQLNERVRQDWYSNWISTDICKWRHREITQIHKLDLRLSSFCSKPIWQV